MRKRLSIDECNAALNALHDWVITSDGLTLTKSFKFGTFKEALTFINRVGEKAEQLDHHPDWSNSYNRVDVNLTTHSAKGLTMLDFELAKHMDKIAGEMIKR